MSLLACFGSRKRETRPAFDYWDCSNLGLSDLPKEVLHHRRTLRQLSLATNNIRDVPKSIFVLEQLMELDLSENVILFLPPTIRSFRSLTSLNVSKNSLSTIPDSIRECQDLLHLDVSANSLGSVPDGLTELRQLRTLSLNDCQLEELPPNIGRLNKLETLELRENMIATLPQSICHLTLLERLDLGVNEIDTLSGVIGSLESLSELWLDGNLLNNLPDEIGSLRNLKFLEVSENQLMFLPLSTSCLVSLQDLHLADNLLTLLPDTMGELRNLRMLKMDRNRITALPQTMDGWTSLVELSLSQNFLEELPAVIGGLDQLENLNVDENSLFSVPPELGALSSLRVLSLRANNLTELPSEIGHLSNLSILNVVGNRLQFLPFSVTSLEKLTALWIAENQNRPLLEMQLTRSGEGHKMLTCILLPQRDSESPISSDANSPQLNHKPHPTAVNFDPKVQDPKSKLTRDPTPYPKEFHVKALQWRSAREEAAGHTPDKQATPTDVPLRSNARSRAVHRPYSLIRALSDPIEPGDLVMGGNSRPSSRKRELSHERKEGSRSPNCTMTTTPVTREGGRRSERPRSGSYCSSPSPPPLSLPTYHSPGHLRHQGEVVEWPMHQHPNGTRGGILRYSASPGDDLNTALISNNNNSNNNNNNNNVRRSRSPPAVYPAVRTAPPKSGTYPPVQQPSMRAAPISVAAALQRYPRLHSSPQAQSEASTPSHSDTANPRYSSSVESGFDADMEQDPASVCWYMSDHVSPEQMVGRQQRRRHCSDSATRSHTPYSAPQGSRRRSSNDYDRLEQCVGGVSAYSHHQRHSYSSSPITCGPPQIVTHHQKASHSFDSTELYSRAPQVSAVPRPTVISVVKVPQQIVSFTAAAKTARNGHARSRSDPDDLVPVEEATPTRHAHRSAKGSQSPSPLSPYYVNVGVHRDPSSHSRYSPAPLVSPSSCDPTYHRQAGLGRRVGGADHTPHQRYPFSDDSQVRGSGAEPAERATPKNISKAVSQDSGFNSASNTLKIVKVELKMNPSLGLGIREGGTEKDGSTKPGYHVYRIVAGSPADLCGKIKLGDRVIEINGVGVSTLDLPDILVLLEIEQSKKISLTLHRDVPLTLL